MRAAMRGEKGGGGFARLQRTAAIRTGEKRDKKTWKEEEKGGKWVLISAYRPAAREKECSTATYRERPLADEFMFVDEAMPPAQSGKGRFPLFDLVIKENLTKYFPGEARGKWSLEGEEKTFRTATRYRRPGDTLHLRDGGGKKW